MNNSEIDDDLQGIAVIGMSGRFPGAANVDEFWENLRRGVESISFFSDKEMEASGVSTALLNRPDFVGARGVLEGIELFDASFFGFNPREAEILDPQRRLFMECAWEAMENAGYDSETYGGVVGLYAGGALSTYLLNVILKSEDMELADIFSIQIGNDKDHLATQTSYKLNLKGPSVTVQTACSTSLVAAHMACESLLDYQCDIALAGGVAIRVPQKRGYLYEEGMINSPDGHCRTFDAGAKGTVGGNGAGVVVLKRLADAVADGDYVHAIIKGSAINNDGATKIGYTAPSLEGQAEVIAKALVAADVPAATVTYVEAHGTATPIGDPIEIAALKRAFLADTGKKNSCAVGSVKSNIGHLDAAAGIAGLIKTVLMLKHRLLPASLHFERPNPEIDFTNSPFYVNTKLSEWMSETSPLRAGVSSFGLGGTNAHAILEESPAAAPSGSSRSTHLLLLSAKTATALGSVTSNLSEHLRRNPNVNFADIAYTYQVGRRAFDHRRMLLCHGREDALEALEALDARTVITAEATQPREVVFMFPGEGTEFVSMAVELYMAEKTFREQVDLCSELLEPHMGLDLRQVLCPEAEQSGEAARQLEQTSVTQPALFVVEYALAKLWMEWGIRPRAMIGHSVGEYVAACLAGVFSFEDALSLVAARGRLMQQMPRGAMLAVPLPEQDVVPLLSPDLDLAATNSSSLCVISGPPGSVARLERRLEAEGLKGHPLRTLHAFHSRMTEPVLSRFEGLLKKVKMDSPKIPYVSNVTGTWVRAEDVTHPRYWVKHLRQTVRFAQGLQQLQQYPNWVLLEVGPGETLTASAKRHAGKTAGQIIVPSLGGLLPPRGKPDETSLLRALGILWLSGVSVDWRGFYKHERRRRVPLPTYPFERRRYWIEPREQVELISTNGEQHPEPMKGIHSRPKHARPAMGVDYVVARNDVEQLIAEIWQDLLGFEQVGVYDDFFELGGHSLLATQIISRVRTLLHVEVSLQELLEQRTVAGLAESTRQAERSGKEFHDPAITPVARVGRRVKSSSLPERFALEFTNSGSSAHRHES